LVRSFAVLRAIDPGFETTHVVAARISVPSVRFASDAPSVMAFYQSLVERARALPGMRGAALVDQLPLADPVWGIAVRVQGQAEDFTKPLPMVDHFQIVTPQYFATMGIRLTNGRAFDETDRAGTLPVAIVSQSVAKKYWPKGNAIGQRLGYPYNSPWITIVGVVPDTKQDSLRDAASGSVYVPWAQNAGRSGAEMWLVVRTDGAAAAAGAALRRLVRDTDRSVPISDVRTMADVVSDSMSASRFTMLLVGAFALLALVLGAVGIYGVTSYLVSERTREMGIRIALGATASGVVRLVVGGALRVAAVGVVLGMAGAVIFTRALREWLYGVSTTDPLTLAAVPVVFLAVGLAASYAPARRATRADPATALREQ
jgi:predicted permease